MDKSEAIVDLLSISRVSRLLGVDDRRIYKLIYSGGLPAVRIGARHLVNRATLLEWAKGSKLNVSERNR